MGLNLGLIYGRFKHHGSTDKHNKHAQVLEYEDCRHNSEGRITDIIKKKTNRSCRLKEELKRRRKTKGETYVQNPTDGNE
ncbi:hypothetical protein VTN02DRAFT_971 [Thermoascus thermophilus]